MTKATWIVGAMAFAVATVGTTLPASSLSFDRFYTLDDIQRENFVSTALHYYYFNYADNPQLVHRAECMTDIDNDRVPDSDQELFDFVINDLEDARATATHNGTVEGVIEAIILRECDQR